MDRVGYLERLQHYKPEVIPDNNLKKVRVDNGLSLKELAEISGTSTNEICQVEIGAKSAVFEGKWKHWVKIAAEVLKDTPENLFPREICKIGGIFELEEEDFLNLDSVKNERIFIDYEDIIDSKSVLFTLKNKLNENEYRVILHTYWHDEKINDVSVMIGLSNQRVSQIRKRALEKLKNVFKR